MFDFFIEWIVPIIATIWLILAIITMIIIVINLII